MIISRSYSSRGRLEILPLAYDYLSIHVVTGHMCRLDEKSARISIYILAANSRSIPALVKIEIFDPFRSQILG